MINEIQLNNILSNNNYKIKSNKSLFGSPLKKFIKDIYNKFDIPKESFIIGLFYIYNYYNLNKSNNKLIDSLFTNINLYIFTCILISLKHIHDEKLNIDQICNLINIKKSDFIKTELIILKGLNWNTSFNNNNFYDFNELFLKSK